MNAGSIPAVRIIRRIAASPRQIYRAWLDPETITRWMAPGMACHRAEVDERVGGRYSVWQGNGTMEGGFEAEILELVPDRRIVFTWGFVGPQRRNGPVYDSLLTITFRDVSDANSVMTELELLHERLDELAAGMPYAAENVEIGWTMVIDQLEDLLAG